MPIVDYSDPFLSKPRSVQEVAEYLGSTEKFIWNQIWRGHLRVHRFSPKLLRIMPADLKDWIQRAGEKTPA